MFINSYLSRPKSLNQKLLSLKIRTILYNSVITALINDVFNKSSIIFKGLDYIT